MALFIVTCEIGLRFTRLQNIYDYTALFERADPPLPWRMRPGVHVVSRGLSHQCPPVDYDIDSHGYRESLPAGPKRAGSFRIVTLGDSDTFGESVQLTATWPKALERELHARAGMDVEVFNRGVPGYDLDHFPTVLSESWSLDPDLVIVEICDVTGANQSSDYFFERQLFRWSYLYRLWIFVTLNGWNDNDAASIAGLRDLIDQCRRHNVPLLAFELQKGPRVIDSVRAQAQSGAKPFIDWITADEFVPYESEPCDPHPSAAMHARVAQQLAGHLTRKAMDRASLPTFTNEGP